MLRLMRNWHSLDGLMLGSYSCWWTGVCLPIQLILVIRLRRTAGCRLLGTCVVLSLSARHLLGHSSWLVLWNVFDLELIHSGHSFDANCLVVGCMLGCSYWLVVWPWNPSFLDPSDGVFGRFDRAALLRLPQL